MILVSKLRGRIQAGSPADLNGLLKADREICNGLMPERHRRIGAGIIQRLSKL